jgi:DNA invertase Pin-like site-specific DNA recombinase
MKKINKHKVIGYCRVSMSSQDVDNQELEISRYAHKNKIRVEDYISIEISSRKDTKSRLIDKLMGNLKTGDTLDC